MGRFHQSMYSWNQPTETGPTESKHDSDGSSDEQEIDFEAAAFEAAAFGAEAFESDEFDSHDNDSAAHDFNFDSTSRSHIRSRRSFFLPLHYTASYRYPLVVWLHSNGFNENQIDHVMPHISLRNYVGVGIRGTRAADSMGHRFDWHGGPTALAATHDAVVEAVEEAQSRFSVNQSRVVVAGYRDGGTMALRMAMREPDRFAGAISLGGRMPQGAIRNVDQLRRRRLPMLWQWGQSNADYTEPNLQSDCRSVMAMGGQVEVRQYAGDDEMDTVVLGDVDDWIMRRIVTNSSVADSDRWTTSPTLYSSN